MVFSGYMPRSGIAGVYGNSIFSFLRKRMDKEDVVHIYNGILFSHKKERNWVICRDVDGPRDCHTE